VSFISDDVGVMNKGKLVEMGPAHEVYRNPKMEYTQNLLSAIPRGMPKELRL